MAVEVTIIQSYRRRNVPNWIRTCIESVRHFAQLNGHHYQFFDDDNVAEVLDPLFLKKVGNRWAMKMDLARLLFSQKILNDGVGRVVWIDADVLVIDPEQFDLNYPMRAKFCFAREIWIEQSGKVRNGVHNAFCMFEKGNPFLDFYIHACNEMMAEHSGESLAPQLLGPKFLKMQKPFLGDVLDYQVEMWSPWVMEDEHLFLKQRELEGKDAVAANLCHSMDCGISMDRFVDQLLAK